jgi:hypothetical protein
VIVVDHQSSLAEWSPDSCVPRLCQPGEMP